MPKLQHQQKHQQQLHKKKRHQPQQWQQHKKTTHHPHHKKKRHQKGATPEGDPSPQEKGDAAQAATGAEDHRPEREKEWGAKVVAQTIKEITE